MNNVAKAHTYDLSGNRTTKYSYGATTTYTYDGQNNLISLMGNQYNTSTFTYDANGDRLTRLNQTHTTQYYYYDTNLLFTKRDGQIDVRYLYDDGAVYCAVYNDIPYWYNTDIRGSVTNILKGDATSSITTSLNKSYVYDAYGNTDVTSTSEFRNSIAYTGAIFDQETGLYYLMSRYYDPAIAQFISEDSYRGDGKHFWNLYMYCEGDPINRTDRDGCESVQSTHTKKLNKYAKMVLTLYYQIKTQDNLEHIKLNKVNAKIICKSYPSGNYIGNNTHMLSRYISYCIIGTQSGVKGKSVYMNTESGNTAKRAYLVCTRSKTLKFNVGYLAKNASVIRVKFHIDFL